MVNKKPLSLGRRVLFSGLLAGLMVAVLVGTLVFPQWKLTGSCAPSWRPTGRLERVSSCGRAA